MAIEIENEAAIRLAANRSIAALYASQTRGEEPNEISLVRLFSTSILTDSNVYGKNFQINVVTDPKEPGKAFVFVMSQKQGILELLTRADDLDSEALRLIGLVLQPEVKLKIVREPLPDGVEKAASGGLID